MKTEPSWMMKVRENAKNAFDSLVMPKSQYTNLKLDFDSILRRKSKKEWIPERIKKVMDDRTKIYFVQLDNNCYINIPENMKNKIILEDMQTALDRHEDLVRKAFEKRSVKYDENKIIAFNFANFNSGMFLHVPKNIEVDVHYILAMSSGSSVISQNILFIEEGATVNFMEEYYSEKQGDESFHSCVIEAFAGQNSAFNFISVQNFSEKTTSIVTRRATAQKDSNFKWVVARLGAKLSKDCRDTDLVGEGASVDDIEVFFGTGTQHFDITANINHKVPNTRGNVLVKGVLKDRARSVSQGMIKIDKNAQKTDSFLAEHTLILNKEARSDAIPGLEIEANDVKATHSASVSQIDGEQVFYLNSRGLDIDSSKKLIVLGFLESALEKITVFETSNRFKELIEKKWG